MSYVRTGAGLLAWCLAGWGIWTLAIGAQGQRAPAASRWAADVSEYVAKPRQPLALVLPEPRVLAVGDPIFVADAGGDLRQAGEITALGSAVAPLPVREAKTTTAQAVLYPAAPPCGDDAKLCYVARPDSLAFAAETLLPPEKRAQIAAVMSGALESHREEIVAALKPVAERSLRDALAIVEEELPKALANHRGELQALGAKYQHDIVEREIVPLVQKEIWPIVRRNSEPTASNVGKEIWQRVSLWRFGWRYAYDTLPLTEDRLVQEEWRRFVDAEALPILQRHSGEFLQVVQDTLRDVAKNEQVRAAFRRSVEQAIDDPELRRVVRAVLQESILDNVRLKESLDRNWTGPEAKAAFKLAAVRLEPHVRRIGDLIFGTPETGISPEFAQVLRHQILHKDRRWLLLQPAKQAAAAGVSSGQRPASLVVDLNFRPLPPALLTTK